MTTNAKVKMLRPLCADEIALEDPEWMDEKTVCFYVPCWFNVDTVFSGLYVNTCDNDDYINLYCTYNVVTGEISLFYIYANNSGGNDYDRQVEIDAETLINIQAAIQTQKESGVFDDGQTD